MSAAGDREQKMLDAASENILGRLNDVKGTLGSLITKMETDPRLNWHSFLDSQASLAGQMNSLLKSVKSERTPSLKKYTILPLLLSADRDDDLLRLTENRVQAFSHDLVPHYLRTKPEPEVEKKYNMYESRVNHLMTESLVKQFHVLEKITGEMLKVINREREEIESKANSRSDVDKTHVTEDTMLLLSAVSSGKMLRPTMPNVPQVPTSSAQMGVNRGPPQGAKPPSTIRTNIKAAAQVHPYHRN